MRTISNRVETWLMDRPFHMSFLARGLLNSSALARDIRPELEQQAGEKLSEQAITLAINRLTRRLTSNATVSDDDGPSDITKSFAWTNFDHYIGEVSAQSGLSILTIPQTSIDEAVLYEVLWDLHAAKEYTLYTRGVWHTALISTRRTIEQLADHFAGSIVTHDLAAVTVKLRPGHLPVPGVCAFVLEKLAQHGINLAEVTSAHDELTVIVEKQFMQPTLDCLL